jgi:hypothetical protein
VIQDIILAMVIINDKRSERYSGGRVLRFTGGFSDLTRCFRTRDKSLLIGIPPLILCEGPTPSTTRN